MPMHAYNYMQTSKNYYSKWCGDEAKIYVWMMLYITDGVMFSRGFLGLCFLVFPRPILANVVELYNNYYIIKNYNSVNTLFRQNVQLQNPIKCTKECNSMQHLYNYRNTYMLASSRPHSFLIACSRERCWKPLKKRPACIYYKVPHLQCL